MAGTGRVFLRCEIPRGGETTGRPSKRSITAGTGRDYRSGSPAGAAGPRNRLGVSRSALCQRLHAGSGPTRPADPAGGGAVDREAQAQPVGRSAVRALAGEPLLPILLRRAELLPPAAVRPLVTDTLAAAAGRGAAGGIDPGEPVGGAPDRCAGKRPVRDHGGRHHGAAESDRAPNRCTAVPSLPGKLVDLAGRHCVPLRQSYRRVAKRAALMVGRYTHAHQFKRARRALKFLPFGLAA
jgi:hypothetical protein